MPLAAGRCWLAAYDCGAHSMSKSDTCSRLGFRLEGSGLGSCVELGLGLGLGLGLKLGLGLGLRLRLR